MKKEELWPLSVFLIIMLQILLIILKICNIITISWIMVLAPIIIFECTLGVLIMIIAILGRR